MQNVVDVPIAVAAERLGVSPEAVRKRIGRKSLAGVKRDGQWYVALVATDTRPDTHPDGGRTDPDDHPDASGRDQVALIAELRGRIAEGSAALQRETERLATALVRSQQGEAELRRLLSAEQQTVAGLRAELAALRPAFLPAPVDTVTAAANGAVAVAPTLKVSTPWWRFWARP
jgi:hypothetical protein